VNLKYWPNKFETRNPKFETIFKMLKIQRGRFEFCNSGLRFACHFDRREKSFFVSDFDIRISDLSLYKVTVYG